MSEFLIGWFFGMAFALGMILFHVTSDLREFRSEAIERGYALRCPTTGEFAWKGECDE